MGKTIDIIQKRASSFIIYSALAIWLISGCAVPSATQTGSDVPQEPVIEKMDISSSPSETIVELVSSSPAPYTTFKLNDPPRVIVDIRGKRGENLSALTNIGDGKLGDIRFEEGKTQAMTTRMVVTLQNKVDYLVSPKDNVIRLLFTPKPVETANKEDKNISSAMQKSDSDQQNEAKISEPRILLQPKKSGLNQVLGIDFTMLEQGKSRLTITTDKKVQYDLDRKGEKTITLKLSEAMIPPILLKGIDTSHFDSSIDMVRPEYSPGKKDAQINIDLKEMVPFHVKQADNTLLLDFGKTLIKPVEKKIIPLNLAEAQTVELAAKQETPKGQATAMTAARTATRIPVKGKGFKGEPMYLDFVNADVTHILRLINEVSDDNIIWDPEITGQKVSMILKDVPWDEALELILKNNALAKRYVGDNIIWVTTKAKMKQIEAEEEAEARKIQDKIEAEMKKEEEKEKKEEEQQPLITEYLPVDFASAAEIKDHITLSGRGTMSVDERTNTIIIKDIASIVNEAKETIKQFDTPVKQIMIEARIVDASDEFIRDLGVAWQSPSGVYRDNTQGGYSVPVTAIASGGGGGDIPTTAINPEEAPHAYGASFTTSSPTGWAGNMALSYAMHSAGLLKHLTLSARLALAENEGKAKTISAPKVIAREGTAASISSGDSIIIPATENVASTTLDATLSLTVTPSAVSYNDFITLDIQVTDDQAPSTSRLLRKAMNTTLMIKSGDTAVIGGILKESESDAVSGIPVLKDVPGLGWLFKAKNRVTKKSELLIFLTPTVLPSPIK